MQSACEITPVPAGFTTGQVRHRLKVAEHRLVNLIRGNRLDVPLVGNRRIWSESHIRKAAQMLGVEPK